MAKLKDKTGKIYGRWTVLSFGHYHYEPSGTKIPYWQCQCECGTIREVNGANLTKGKSISCGCYNREIVSSRESPVKRPYGEASRHQLFLAYKQGAKKRNLDFQIDENFFADITSRNCYYCGSPPSNENKIAGLNGNYIFNGIDRVNNDIGYLKGNCVPACKICNYAKHSLGKDDFLLWIKQLVKFQTS